MQDAGSLTRVSNPKHKTYKLSIQGYELVWDPVRKVLQKALFRLNRQLEETGEGGVHCKYKIQLLIL